jgi:hypothetical protein
MGISHLQHSIPLIVTIEHLDVIKITPEKFGALTAIEMATAAALEP